MTPGTLAPSNRADPNGGSTGSSELSRAEEQTVDEARSPASRTVAAIPAYNESLTIGSLVHQARKHVDMVVVVDDGSSDGTAEVARQAGARVLRHETNQGKAQAIRTLFDWALTMDVEHLALLDGDGQHDPHQLPQMLEPVKNGEADVSLGFRFGDDTEMPLYRRIGKRVLDYATALGAAGEVTDSQCGFRAFNRRALDTIELQEDGFAVESEMVVSASENGLSMQEVPIACRYDEVTNANTEDPLAHGVGVLERTIRLVTERRPLLFMGLPGFVTVLAGIGLGTWVVWTLKMTGRFAVGTALLTSLLVLAGTFLGLTAVLLHVVPRTIAKHLGKEAKIEVHEQGLHGLTDLDGATTIDPRGNGDSRVHAEAPGTANAASADDEASDDSGASPQPRPPEQIPDRLGRSDETPAGVER